MNKKVLIVEDQYLEAYDLQLMLEKAGYVVCGIARSVPIAQKMIADEHPDLILLDIFLKGKQTGIDLAKQLKDDNIAFIYLSANSNEEVLAAAKTTEPYGFIVKPYREKDLLITLEIAAYRHLHSLESKYRREADILLQLEKTIKTTTEWKTKCLSIGKLLQQLVPFDFLAIGFDDAPKYTSRTVCYFRIGFNEYQTIGVDELTNIARISMDELLKFHISSGKESGEAYLNGEVFEKSSDQRSLHKLFKEVFHLNSLLSLPLHSAGEAMFSLFFYSKRPDSYSLEQINTLNRLRETLRKCFALSQSLLNPQPTPPTLVSDNQISALPSQSTAEPRFEGIIGNSHLLLGVLDHVAQVAPFETSVLLLGESGTGKERIADHIHNLSPRRSLPLVKINCATLPATLIESELFGHEKGSFTGATEKRTGKFERANGGSIFLDEIGEMPVDLQVKLLRVLQEKEIEPIGGKGPVKINVRVIAATNRNLEKEVAEGRFRLDLYYRLNVFPIIIPALRERMEDIPELVHHFVTQFNLKAGKKIRGLSDKAMKKLMTYHFPGNIRELENIIERSTLLAKGDLIEEITLPILQKDLFESTQSFQLKTIPENERAYIISVLKKCKGKVWGADGAAEALNLPPSTLKSKMKKLDITKDSLS